MEKANIYLIESPLQLINAIEAASRRNNQRNHLYIALSGKKKTDSQIIAITNTFPWSDVTYVNRVYFNKNYHWITRAAKHYFISLSAKIKFKGVNTCIFIGEFRSYWMHLVTCTLNPDQRYLLDDGSISISIQKNYLSKNKSHPFEFALNIRNIAKLLIYHPILILNRNKTWNLFTSFDTPPNQKQIIEINNYEHLKSNHNPSNFSEKFIYYFGSKYSESKIITFESEINFLKKIYQFHKTKNLPIKYIPHREDSRNKIDAIKNLGYLIEEIEVPAEIFILENSSRIEIISGAYTTVLNNAKKIFPEIEILSFILPIDKTLDKKIKSGIENSYENLRKLGINTINVDTLI